MKQGTTSKLKFKKLRRALGDLPLYQAVGILESLWQLTAADAPLGDIGRFSNDDIAMSVEWKGDPDELIEALVATRWLDKSDEHRLVIHHWDQHVPRYLKLRVQRQGESFVTGQNGELEPASPPAADTGAQRRTVAHSVALPSQAESEPSQAKSSRAEPARARRTPLPAVEVVDESAPPGGSGSDFQKSPLSDSGSSEEARRQIENLGLRNAKVSIAERLRVAPPESHPEGSNHRKQARADFVTISKVVDHCRGDPTVLETLERLAAEVAAGKLIKKPPAAWVKRVKDAGLFYK